MPEIPPALCTNFTPKWFDTDQNFFLNFCYPTELELQHVLLYLIHAFPSEKKRHKHEGHPGIDLLGINVRMALKK